MNLLCQAWLYWADLRMDLEESPADSVCAELEELFFTLYKYALAEGIG